MLRREFLAKNKTVIMSQSLYSPDLVRADYFFFSKLKAPMKGKRFATIEEIKEKSKQKLLAIPKNAFQKCFEDWKKCWHSNTKSRFCPSLIVCLFGLCFVRFRGG